MISWRKNNLDHKGLFLQRGNKIVVLSCLMAVSLRPLFFYVPVIDDRKKCLSVDSTMEITASVLRSFTDIFYMLHITLQSHGFIVPLLGLKSPSTPTGKVVILIINLKMADSSYLNAKNVLQFVVIFQYVPRFTRIYPFYKKSTTSAQLTKTAWAGAAFSLFLFMLASHVSLIYSTGNWSLLVFVLNRTTDKLLETSLWNKTHAACILFCDGAVWCCSVVYGFFREVLLLFLVGAANTEVYLTSLVPFAVLLVKILKQVPMFGKPALHFSFLSPAWYCWRFSLQPFRHICNPQLQHSKEETKRCLFTIFPRGGSVSSNTSSPSETENMEEANHAGEDQGNIDHAKSQSWSGNDKEHRDNLNS
uniref:Uncharacterized protein n=1 Tax=Salix viminalis TaxID=40686 RepID=A0A6N2K9L1_SALVM